MLELLRIIRSANLERGHWVGQLAGKRWEVLFRVCWIWAESREGWVLFYWLNEIQMNENQL